jgi:hypothetical protein
MSYQILFDNTSGRVVARKKNPCNQVPQMRFNSPPKQQNSPPNQKPFATNIENRFFPQLNHDNNKNNYIDIDKLKIKEDYEKTFSTNTFVNSSANSSANTSENTTIQTTTPIKNNLVYGIKKTILSDFNYLNISTNSIDFKIGVNKNTNQKNLLFDSFYLFPNISEINTKNETNVINEKRVDSFKNINNSNDIQYFPIDFIACGNSIILKNQHKLIIKNIFWNIFQSIDISNYRENELLSVIPNKSDFQYKPIKLQINFELHAQLTKSKLQNRESKILPYRNFETKSITPANSCLYNVKSVIIETLNGSKSPDIEINLLPDLDIDSALLCVRVSVPDYSTYDLKGSDKANLPLYGKIPFSQFILNFEYELK